MIRFGIEDQTQDVSVVEYCDAWIFGEPPANVQIEQRPGERQHHQLRWKPYAPTGGCEPCDLVCDVHYRRARCNHFALHARKEFLEDLAPSHE